MNHKSINIQFIITYMTYQNIDLKYINNRINEEVCYDTIKKLTDINLLDEYKKCNSVQEKIKELTLILKKYNIKNEIINLIVNEYILLNLIPPGTKGIIRGKTFNKIVKNTILNLKLDNEKFEIKFEEKCESNITSEIPDWYILEKATNKVIIGMNQLSLVGGGQQTNRGSKYLIDNKHNTEKSKLLCVICNYIQFTSNKNKEYKLFQVGFLNDTICYIKNIKNIINKFFN